MMLAREGKNDQERTEREARLVLRIHHKMFRGANAWIGWSKKDEAVEGLKALVA
jgi:hypothetical protein